MTYLPDSLREWHGRSKCRVCDVPLAADNDTDVCSDACLDELNSELFDAEMNSRIDHERDR